MMQMQDRKCHIIAPKEATNTTGDTETRLLSSVPHSLKNAETAIKYKTPLKPLHLNSPSPRENRIQSSPSPAISEDNGSVLQQSGVTEAGPSSTTPKSRRPRVTSLGCGGVLHLRTECGSPLGQRISCRGVTCSPLRLNAPLCR